MNTRRFYDGTLSNLHKDLIFASEVPTEKVKQRIICTQRERVNKLSSNPPCWFTVRSQRAWLAPDPSEGERIERLARAGRPVVVAQRFGVRSRLAGPLLRLELARAAAGSKLPANESGSKLPHSRTQSHN
jgi:hypothetical protein